MSFPAFLSNLSKITVFILFFFGVPAAALYAQVDRSEFSIAESIADGEWVIYNTDNSSLPSNFVTSLAIGDDEVIWIGTGTGIASLEELRWNLFPRFMFQGSHILSIATQSQSSANNLRTLPSVWVAVGDTIDGNRVGLGLARYDGRRSWDQVDTSNSGLHSNDIKKIGFDSSGTGWAIPSHGFTLSYYDGNEGEWSAHSPSASAQREYERAGLTEYSAGVVDEDGTLLLALGGSVIHYDKESWVMVFGGIIDGRVRTGEQSFSTIAVAPSGDIWVGTFSGGVQHFDGETVTSHDPDIDGIITSIALDRYGNPWVGAHGALAHFDGEDWTVYNTENTELVRINVNAIAIDINGNKWIGTDEGLVVFNETGVGTSAESEPSDSEIPDRFVLHGNYPNPFNPSTTFDFELPEAAMVRLIVYDALGRQVANVVSEWHAAGRYDYVWDARHLPSGVYVYRLEAGNYVTVKKALLVK